MRKIIIAGGSGFLGQVLTNYFLAKKSEVKILTRTPKRDYDVFWNAKDFGSWTNTLNNANVLINLTGKSIDCRYNKKIRMKFTIQ